MAHLKIESAIEVYPSALKRPNVTSRLEQRPFTKEGKHNTIKKKPHHFCIRQAITQRSAYGACPWRRNSYDKRNKFYVSLFEVNLYPQHALGLMDRNRRV
jgi:hypothetical protein